MTTKHTPGPWGIGFDGFKVHVYAGGALPIGTFFPRNADSGDQREEAEANARLSAAAPELLAALKDALERLEALDKRLIEAGDNDPTYDKYDLGQVIRGRATIAKAEG
jgi:hypothetical protein